MRRNSPSFANWNGLNAVQQPVDGSARSSDTAEDFDANRQNERVQALETDAFQLLLRQFSELREYFVYYVSSRVDSAKLILRNTLLSLALAVLAFVAVASLSVLAIWFVLNGAAEGLGVLFGNRPWAGSLLTGLLLMAGLVSGVSYVVNGFKKIAREGTITKYENQQSQQQVRYGHNVADRAAADRSEQK